jgi:cytochrome c oxidase cbb3-type subunit 1
MHNISLVGMVLAFCIAGYKGGMILLHGNVADIKPVEAPYMEMVGIFGLFVLLANIIFAYNIYMTVQVAKGRRELPVSEREEASAPILPAMSPSTGTFRQSQNH